MGMRGFVPANTVYAMILVVLFILAVGQLFYYFLHRETNLEYFPFDFYVTRNGMNLAKLYLENSLDYSVYQAMYDNGRRGGWKEVKTSGNLSYWQETGGRITPSLKDINESLRTAIVENLNKYVQGGYTFLEKYYALPTFKPENIKIIDSDKGIKVFASSDNKIRFYDVIEHTTGEERITIESPPEIVNTYSFDYFELYKKSSEIFRKVKSTSCNALKEGDERTTTEGDYKYTQKVLSKTSSSSGCVAEVRVNVTKENSEMFPVFNGTHVAFEPISMVYIVKIEG